MKYCKNYLGVSCIDGSCPNAIAEELPYEKIKCEDCWRYKGCADCAMPDMDNCPALQIVRLGVDLWRRVLDFFDEQQK